MGQQDGDGVERDWRPLATAVIKAKDTIQAYDDFRSSTVTGWVDVSASVAEQHQALHIALDMCYGQRDTMLRDPQVINLINALETAVLANSDIMTKITEFLASLETLSKRMDEIV
jgi:hypothetical protein